MAAAAPLAVDALMADAALWAQHEPGYSALINGFLGGRGGPAAAAVASPAARAHFDALSKRAPTRVAFALTGEPGTNLHRAQSYPVPPRPGRRGGHR